MFKFVGEKKKHKVTLKDQSFNFVHVFVHILGAQKVQFFGVTTTNAVILFGILGSYLQ